MYSVLVGVSIAVRDTITVSNSHKGKLLTGAGLQFRGLACYHHSGETWQGASRSGAGEASHVEQQEEKEKVA